MCVSPEIARGQKVATMHITFAESDAVAVFTLASFQHLHEASNQLAAFTFWQLCSNDTSIGPTIGRNIKQTLHGDALRDPICDREHE